MVILLVYTCANFFKMVLLTFVCFRSSHMSMACSVHPFTHGVSPLLLIWHLPFFSFYVCKGVGPQPCKEANDLKSCSSWDRKKPFWTAASRAMAYAPGQEGPDCRCCAQGAHGRSQHLQLHPVPHGAVVHGSRDASGPRVESELRALRDSGGWGFRLLGGPVAQDAIGGAGKARSRHDLRPVPSKPPGLWPPEAGDRGRGDLDLHSRGLSERAGHQDPC